MNPAKGVRSRLRINQVQNTFLVSPALLRDTSIAIKKANAIYVIISLKVSTSTVPKKVLVHPGRSIASGKK